MRRGSLDLRIPSTDKAPETQHLFLKVQRVYYTHEELVAAADCGGFCLHRHQLYMHVLVQNGLRLALGAVVAGEARAGTGLVVAEPTSGAVAALGATVPAHNIVVGRALTEGAVWATGSDVTDASLLLEGVPRSFVNL